MFEIKTRIDREVYSDNNVIKVLIKKDEDNFTRFFGVGLFPEFELLNDNSTFNGRNNNRKLFVFAYLYYDSLRKASKILTEAGVNECSMSNINYHLNEFKKIDSKQFKEYEILSIDEKKKRLDFECPDDIVLPLLEGHSFNEDEPLPF